MSATRAQRVVTLRRVSVILVASLLLGAATNYLAAGWMVWAPSRFIPFPIRFNTTIEHREHIVTRTATDGHGHEYVTRYARNIYTDRLSMISGLGSGAVVSSFPKVTWAAFPEPRVLPTERAIAALDGAERLSSTSEAEDRLAFLQDFGRDAADASMLGPNHQLIWVAGGWPSRSVQYLRTHSTDGGPYDERIGCIPGRAGILQAFRGFDTIPYEPVWSGIALNTPLYALPWLLVLSLLVFGKPGLRRRRNQCLRCSYSLDDLTAGRCPECGDTIWTPAAAASTAVR